MKKQCGELPIFISQMSYILNSDICICCGSRCGCRRPSACQPCAPTGLPPSSALHLQQPSLPDPSRIRSTPFFSSYGMLCTGLHCRAAESQPTQSLTRLGQDQAGCQVAVQIVWKRVVGRRKRRRGEEKSERR